MNTAIIVAAGSGKRFGADKPKQFLALAGKPVIIHTLQRFEDCASVDEIVLVLSADAIEGFRNIVESHELKKLKTIVAGGETRAGSVWNGLQAIENAEIVLVHDGARPLVSVAEIAATIEKAKETGAACLVAPVTDTIKEIEADKIVKTVDRSKLRRGLTPQAFRLEILRRAFAQNMQLEATDESFLVEQSGVFVSIVEGSARNIKITTPEDLILAEALLKNSIK